MIGQRHGDAADGAAARALGTVLVTGAGGRLGRRLLARLQHRADARVIAAMRSVDDADGMIAVPLDLADHAAVRSLVAELDPDTVIHLGAIAGAAAEADSLTAIAVNIGSTRAIAEAIGHRADRRIVLASTAAVYGDGAPTALDERAPLLGTSVYARTKANAERALEEYDAPTVALRIANIYGPGFDDSLVARLLRSRDDEPVALRDLDGFVRDYVHADDVAEALITAAGARLPERHAVINIGGGAAVSNRSLLETIGRHRPVITSAADGPPSALVVDIARARAVLGFAPRGFGEGIAALIDD